MSSVVDGSRFAPGRPVRAIDNYRHLLGEAEADAQSVASLRIFNEDEAIEAGRLVVKGRTPDPSPVVTLNGTFTATSLRCHFPRSPGKGGATNSARCN